MTEQWLIIPSFPDYEVSNLGRIRSYGRLRPRVLTGSLSGSGYRYVKLSAGGRKRSVSVHSLVAEAFHGARPAGHEVRHLDGNRLNNTANNLRYGTASENRHDSVRHGTHRSLRSTSLSHVVTV